MRTAGAERCCVLTCEFMVSRTHAGGLVEVSHRCLLCSSACAGLGAWLAGHVLR